MMIRKGKWMVEVRSMGEFYANNSLYSPKGLISIGLKTVNNSTYRPKPLPARFSVPSAIICFTLLGFFNK